MKITANIATQPSRIDSLLTCLSSIIDQFDVINIYLNDFKEVPKELRFNPKINIVMGSDLADNAKFYFTKYHDEGDVYFTIDDDIIYPSDYKAQTLLNLAKYPGHVITYHGRKLTEKECSYYHSHRQFHYDRNQELDYLIDVAGTGVTAFVVKGNLFQNIHNSEHKRMSDLVFSYKMAIYDIPIMCCAHPRHWLIPIPNENTILKSYVNLPTPIQDYIADLIYDKRNEP